MQAEQAQVLPALRQTETHMSIASARTTQSKTLKPRDRNVLSVYSSHTELPKTSLLSYTKPIRKRTPRVLLPKSLFACSRPSHPSFPVSSKAERSAAKESLAEHEMQNNEATTQERANISKAKNYAIRVRNAHKKQGFHVVANDIARWNLKWLLKEPDSPVPDRSPKPLMKQVHLNKLNLPKEAKLLEGPAEVRKVVRFSFAKEFANLHLQLNILTENARKEIAKIKASGYSSWRPPSKGQPT